MYNNPLNVKNKTRQKDMKEKAIVKALSFLGGGSDSNSSVIDVKDGRIVRIRPLHYDWKYDPKSVKIYTD